MFKYHSLSVKPEGSFSQTVETDQLTTAHVAFLADAIVGVDSSYDEDEEEEQFTIEDELSELRVRVEYLETLIAGKHLKGK